MHLKLLVAAVLLVLLIACSNVTSLLLARFAKRRTEVLVRAALGASRGRLVRQFVIETLVLYSIGTVAGIVLAMLLLNLLRAVGPDAIPRVTDVGLVMPVLAFTCVMSLVRRARVRTLAGAAGDEWILGIGDGRTNSNR